MHVFCILNNTDYDKLMTETYITDIRTSCAVIAVAAFYFSDSCVIKRIVPERHYIRFVYILICINGF